MAGSILEKHGKGRRHGGGGVWRGHVRKMTAPNTWGPSVSETHGREAGEAAAGPGGALRRGRGNWGRSKNRERGKRKGGGELRPAGAERMERAEAGED